MIEKKVPEIRVRRTRPSDIGRVADFLNRALRRGQPVSPESVLTYLGRAGLLLAEADGEVVGLLGWQAENFVARVTDFLVFPATFRLRAGQALLSMVEDTARELQCEAVVLLMPLNVSSEVIAFWRGFGYSQRQITSLPRPWQEAARGARARDEDQVLMKQLRQDRVLRPL